MDRARRALDVIARKAPSLERYENKLLNDPEFLAVSYSLDSNEAYALIRLLEADKLVEIYDALKAFRITPRGLVASEERSNAPISEQAFVAMKFDPSMEEAWSQGFYEGIKKAGYQPLRIDKKEHVNGITDEIMMEIRRSKFVVADYSGQINGVYFEAGFALGLGLVVIPTCCSEEVGKLHFDIRHINTLLWSSPKDLAVGLAQRIAAVVGEGPNNFQES